MKKHFVTFYSPGMLFSEKDSKPIEKWDIKTAIEISKKIIQRHGAKPYAFRFETQIVANDIEIDGEKLEVKPKTVRQSGLYWLTGKVLTLKDISDDDENRILKSNMKCNGYKAVVENNNSYKFTYYFDKEDIIIDWNGNIIDKGENYY